jgi:proline dehydrogenase
MNSSPSLQQYPKLAPKALCMKQYSLRRQAKAEDIPLLRSIFIALSQNRKLRSFSERSSIGHKLSGRFVAGMSVEEALAACQRVNREGIAVSLDALGESVMTEAEARASADTYHQLLDAIQQRNLNANVSVKLSQMGMDFDPALAERIVGEMVHHADDANTFVRIGTVLQAYLFRTEGDIERLLGQGIRIRLCKGAYKEGPEIAFPMKADVDANYIKLMKRVATFSNNGKGVFCGLATHDEAIVDVMRDFVRKNNVPKTAFEFQMLYGIRRDLQRKLAAEGFGVRVYIPFGPEWYPYFMRRLAERPANVLFLAKNFLKS